MAAQGWEPGQYLGAVNANHAAHYTAANASHIKVTLREENLGLGAKIGSGVGHGECTGLDVFKDILGRLNGKDEADIAKEQKSREDLKRAIYTERKWGTQRFVHGGFLIGDKIQDLISDEAERVRKLAVDGSSTGSHSSTSEEDATPELEKKHKKSKKRKLEEDDSEGKDKTLSKSKGSKKRKLDPEEQAGEVVAVKDRKSKKSRKSKVAEPTEDVATDTGNTGEISEKKRRKIERRERRALREQESSTESVSRKKSKKGKRKAVIDDAPETPALSTKENTPSVPSVPASGYSTPIMMQGRHAVRSRNIAQKRLASMDVASLNQVSNLQPTITASLTFPDIHDQNPFIERLFRIKTPTWQFRRQFSLLFLYYFLKII